jgi:hypothetical protein
MGLHLSCPTRTLGTPLFPGRRASSGFDVTEPFDCNETVWTSGEMDISYIRDGVVVLPIGLRIVLLTDFLQGKS